MHVDSEVLYNIVSFLALARKFPDEFWKEHAQSASYYFMMRGQRRYVVVIAAGFDFRVGAQTGEIRYGAGRRTGCRQNIRDFVSCEDWERGLIKSDSQGCPVHGGRRCDGCGRADGTVGRTKVGLRCGRCRGTDTRQVNMIRRLGA